MSSSARRTLAIATASTVALLALGGCAGGSMQSRTSACTSLEASIAKANAGLNSSFSNLSADPTAAVAKLKEVNMAFAAELKKISNPAIRKAGAAAAGSLQALNVEVRNDLADPASADSTRLQGASDAVETDFAAVAKLCA